MVSKSTSSTTAATTYWPLFGLRLRTPRLELRVPSLRDLDSLAELAAAGVHDPETQPFQVAWTDVTPLERARGTLQHNWATWGAWTPANWTLNLAVARDSEVVGTQTVRASDFPILREVGTGSWVGMRHQGQGIGTEMRAAVLDLAFAGLGAEYATSGAFDYNHASLAVSRKLGYADDGIERHAIRGKPAREIRLRLDRETWEAHRIVPVEIDGLQPCLPLFGLA
jgi:RimJ/RimL family protein N-acetyltransferase